MPRTWRRRSQPVVLAFVAAVTVAACGSGSGAPRAGSARPGAGVAVGSAGTGGAPRAQALAYARCMREHGVALPDPTFDRGGRPEWGAAGGTFAADREDGAFAGARDACEHTWPAMEGRYQRSPEELTRMRTALLAYAACMRTHGISFPDPTFDQDGRPVLGHDVAASEAHDPAFAAAAQACRNAIGDRPVMGATGR